jgi:hypothetical protein
VRIQFYEHLPLDPECPWAKRIEDDLDDPYMAMSGCGEEFREDWERAHRASCKRCQEYGVANVEILD